MKLLKQKLEQLRSGSRRRPVFVFAPYDQLTDRVGPLAGEKAADLGVVLIECPAKAARRPYHVQKLYLILANMRHFALEQAKRGVWVDYRVARGSYADELRRAAAEHGPLRVMRPAERELRVELAPLIEEGVLEETPHTGWLTTEEDFAASQKPEGPWRMDAFYRRVRQRTGILMDDGKPQGERYSFDTENRQSWKGEPEPPVPPRFAPDPIREEVVELLRDRFADHPGKLDPEALPATRNEARRLWRWARESCLPHFGPYEDAMSTASRGLFHSRISPLLNIHRLHPGELVSEVAELDLPLASKEGFIRQVLGWREFVHHVHERTDGFRAPPQGRAPRIATQPGDGGYARWRGEDWPGHGGSDTPADGGACPSHTGARRVLPPAFWGARSGLHCLDEVVESVWDEGWSHHITRLMILGNIATLLDVAPRELTDWFWVAYADAFDWVVEPNVLGMATFAVGELMVTKPYISGAAYIDRMSDYCKDCAFHPKKDCPITSLYWAWLDRHRDVVAANPRVAMPLRTLEKRGAARRRRDAEIFESTSRRLREGEALSPE